MFNPNQLIMLFYALIIKNKSIYLNIHIIIINEFDSLFKIIIKYYECILCIIIYLIFSYY